MSVLAADTFYSVSHHLIQDYVVNPVVFLLSLFTLSLLIGLLIKGFCIDNYVIFH